MRRFNNIYGSEVFPEPTPLMTKQSRVLGLDNRKMSKSYENAIYLGDQSKEVEAKVAIMITDPNRKRRQDPGDPFVCNVYTYHCMYSPAEVIEWSREGCQKAKIGCVDCKKEMAKHLNSFLEPFRERRDKVLKDTGQIRQILKKGTEQASMIAHQTMQEVREAIGMY